MSVIVKGMEMPKYCSDCPLLDGETGRCNILKITVCDYVPKECPLVEVVRCKDCKYYCETERMCNDTNGFDRYWKPTDFCSYGERGEDEQ